jgi:hypothetical protein
VSDKYYDFQTPLHQLLGEEEIEFLRSDASRYRDRILWLRADRDRWMALAEGMAKCLDSSTEASLLLEEFGKAMGDE